MNKKIFNNRKFSQSASSISLTVIVIGLILVINYFGGHNQIELDLTKNKIHAFSDQTNKVMHELKADLRAEYFGDSNGKARYTPLFENYQRLSNHFKIEYIDPNKEPARVRASGIKKINTLVLTYQQKSVKIDDLSEEKITNSILKIEKEKKQTACFVVGHGESSIEDITQNGMQSLKIGLEDQAYEVKEVLLSNVNLITTCNSILMLGPHGDLSKNELKSLEEYLNHGGRAVFAVDAELAQKEKLSKDFRQLLNGWGVIVKDGLIVDPESRKAGMDASVVMINLFNPTHLITKDYLQPSYFPFVRPIDPVAVAPSGLMSITSLAKTNENAWSELDIDSFVKGSAQYNEGVDIKKGMQSVAVAITGKHDTRIVVFGSSQMVNNQYARFGGNLDLFLNSVSWILQDENLISIRTKSDDEGRVELTEQNSIKIFWIIIVVIPFTIMLLGILIWLKRKNR